MRDPIAQAADEIRHDRTHGSRWLARRAVQALADLAASPSLAPDTLRDAARALAAARPAMAVIRNAVGWVSTEALEEATRGAALPEATRGRAAAWLRRWDWAAEDIARHAQAVVAGTVATISFSHTVLHVLKTCRGRISRIVVSESRPGLEGRTTAGELAAAGIPVVLAPDAAVPSLLEPGAVVVLGADAVLATGAVVNKAGTFPLAAAAARLDVRCYVLAETVKITDLPFIPEEGDTIPVIDLPPPGVDVRNPVFDRTPPDLIEGYVTEDGLLRSADLDRYVDRARRYSEALGFPPGV